MKICNGIRSCRFLVETGINGSSFVVRTREPKLYNETLLAQICYDENIKEYVLVNELSKYTQKELNFIYQEFNKYVEKYRI